MQGSYKSWEDVRLEANHLFSTFIPRDQSEYAQTAFDEGTIRNVQDFIDHASADFPLPDDIDHGYWPTICLYWNKAQPYPIMIEIFDDHYELYRSVPLIVDTRHYSHVPGEMFPNELNAILLSELN